MSNATLNVLDAGGETSRRITTQPESAQDDLVEDNFLIQRVAAKDPQAFERLYHKYRPRLERYLAKYLYDPTAVQEASNNVMLVIWKKAAQFQARSKVSTWIFGMARLEARRARAQTATDFDEPAPSAPQEADSATPEMRLDAQEQINTLAAAVATLPQTLQTPIVLSFYHDYSYAQIARRMNCSPATVKARLRQARRRLRAALTRAERHSQSPGLR